MSSITDGTLTVTFRPGPADHDPDRGLRLEKISVECCWATWSSPPQSEDASPDILSNENLSLLMDLSLPVTTFGFELEPSLLSPARFTVDFVSVNGDDDICEHGDSVGDSVGELSRSWFQFLVPGSYSGFVFGVLSSGFVLCSEFKMKANPEPRTNPEHRTQNSGS